MEEYEYQKYKELWAVIWRRYFDIIGIDVKVCEPVNCIRDKFKFDMNFGIIHGEKRGLSVKLTINLCFDVYEGYIYDILYTETGKKLFRANKYKSKTSNTFYDDINFKPEYIEKISSILKVHDKRSYINNEIDKLCRYIHAFRKILDTTDYIKHISSARMFMLCSKKLFGKDVSKIIYKKILFFV